MYIEKGNNLHILILNIYIYKICNHAYHNRFFLFFPHHKVDYIDNNDTINNQNDENNKDNNQNTGNDDRNDDGNITSNNVDSISEGYSRGKKLRRLRPKAYKELTD